MIKRGDLVMVVRGTPCCGGVKDLGLTFTVNKTYKSQAICAKCGSRLTSRFVTTDDGYECSEKLLKKIDPPSTGELSGVPLRIKEPA